MTAQWVTHDLEMIKRRQPTRFHNRHGHLWSTKRSGWKKERKSLEQRLSDVNLHKLKLKHGTYDAVLLYFRRNVLENRAQRTKTCNRSLLNSRICILKKTFLYSLLNNTFFVYLCNTIIPTSAMYKFYMPCKITASICKSASSLIFL